MKAIKTFKIFGKTYSKGQEIDELDIGLEIIIIIITSPVWIIPYIIGTIAAVIVQNKKDL